MKIQADLYEIESSDNFGYKLTANLPSDHVKSKTGIAQKVTFHANLHQVAAKMVSYEIMQADAHNVFLLAEITAQAADKLAAALVKIEEEAK